MDAYSERSIQEMTVTLIHETEEYLADAASPGRNRILHAVAKYVLSGMITIGNLYTPARYFNRYSADDSKQ